MCKNTECEGHRVQDSCLHSVLVSCPGGYKQGQGGNITCSGHFKGWNKEARNGECFMAFPCLQAQWEKTLKAFDAKFYMLAPRNPTLQRQHTLSSNTCEMWFIDCLPIKTNKSLA